MALLGYTHRDTIVRRVVLRRTWYTSGVSMGRLEFGSLSGAWPGEASDFTPLLAARLDQLGDAIGVDLATFGESEVLTAGGRRIDIVAQREDGSEFVIENQFGKADHDHLTRGLAYAVARRARGLVVVAEDHRDEFRAVAQYLNDLAEADPERGIAVWLVEAKAARIGTSDWAPLFTAVVEPNDFTATIEKVRQRANFASLEEFWEAFDSPPVLQAAQTVLEAWQALGHRYRLGLTHVGLLARGPAANGYRVVATIGTAGDVLVPFGSYAGQNSGLPVPPLMTTEFRATADSIFGFRGNKAQARTEDGWLQPERVDEFMLFCRQVAEAYRTALEDGEGAEASSPSR